MGADGTGSAVGLGSPWLVTLAGFDYRSNVFYILEYNRRCVIRKAEVVQTCTESSTAACLQGYRFKVEATWRDYAGNTGSASVNRTTDDTASMTFFDAANVEVTAKVLNFCGVNGSYSVYIGGMTDIEVQITVTDTYTGKSAVYRNPLGTEFSLIRQAPFSCS